MIRKKKYYYKYKKKSKIKIGEIIIFIFILPFIFNTFSKNEQKELKSFLTGILVIIFIYYSCKIIFNLIKFIFKKYKKNKEKYLLPTKVLEIKKIIEGFKPLRNYNKEEPYKIELSGYLKNFFPNLDIEISKNYTRPDIIIENIAIEIKGPTNFTDLKTIPDKIIRYTKERDYLIIVLFNVKLNDDNNKSEEIYENWKNDIEENFSLKLDRIMFIKI